MKNDKKLGQKILNILLTCIFVAGVGIFAYPHVCNMWNAYQNKTAISEYREKVSKLSEAEIQELWDEAEKYNSAHRGNVPADPFKKGREKTSKQYFKLLAIDDSGAMGSIEIPKLNAEYVIYHGTGGSVLKKGVGHLEGTSLPVGGLGTHAAISGHSGLPEAKLFTDIDQLKQGDIFILHILNRTLTYEVDDIRIVLPDEIDSLNTVEGKDYVTLITCTPYGINTHRLLIRGVRTDNIEEIVEQLPYCKAILVGIATLVLIICIILIKKDVVGRRKPGRRRR